MRWSLHTVWRPQASEKVEKTNHILKKIQPRDVKKLIFIEMKFHLLPCSGSGRLLEVGFNGALMKLSMRDHFRL